MRYGTDLLSALEIDADVRFELGQLMRRVQVRGCEGERHADRERGGVPGTGLSSSPQPARWSRRWPIAGDEPVLFRPIGSCSTVSLLPSKVCRNIAQGACSPGRPDLTWTSPWTVTMDHVAGR